MKILLITSSLIPKSGWGTYSLNTLQGLKAQGHEVRVLTAELSGLEPGEMVWLPNRLSMIASPIAWIRCAFAVRRAVRLHRPDIMHVLVETYVIGMPLAGAITKLPPWVMTFLATYSVMPFRLWYTRTLFSVAFAQAAGFLSCSRFTLNRVKEAVQKYGTAAARRNVSAHTCMIRLGIAPLQGLVQRLPSESFKHILFVGGIKERKGVREMLEGCGVYSKSSPGSLRITLVGDYSPDHPYSRELHAIIEKYTMQNSVTFTGHVPGDTLDNLYASADVFMMLSNSDALYFEGYGLVLLEANQRGIPVIGSNDSGCKEAIKEGVSGYVVDAFNPEEIANRLHLILEERRITPEGCQAWARDHSIEQQAQTCETLYSDVLSGRPSAQYAQ